MLTAVTGPSPSPSGGVSGETVATIGTPTPTPPGVIGARGDDQDDDGSSCFPADATVTLETGRVVRMDDLHVGDRVAVGGGAFSDVYLWTHRDAAASPPLVRLATAGGASLRLTPGHLVYVAATASSGAPTPLPRLVAAADVAIGDALVLDGPAAANASTGRVVVAVAREAGAGLYNPQTLHGDIVVNGIRCSTVTAAVPGGVVAAELLLAPWRLAYGVLGARRRRAALDGLFAGGVPAVVDAAGKALRALGGVRTVNAASCPV